MTQEDILRERLPKLPAKWNRLCKQMQALLDEVRTVFPDASYYTASGGFNLLLGASHIDIPGQRESKAQRELVALSNQEKFVVGDGDW